LDEKRQMLFSLRNKSSFLLALKSRCRKNGRREEETKGLEAQRKGRNCHRRSKGGLKCRKK